MKKHLILRNCSSLFILILLSFYIHAQEDITDASIYTTPRPSQGTVTINKPAQLDQLAKINASLSTDFSSRYRIQLYYGNLKGANSTLSNYKSKFTDWDASIVYETPNHKVWVGNFRNRLDADRALMAVQKKFPNAFVFKPNR